MSLVTCPSCDESEDLSGERGDDGTIVVVCGACGASWERDVRLRCRVCGSENLEYAPRPLWERGRGEQRTPAGRFDAYDCIDCGQADATAKRSADPGSPSR
jgi:hypothetical protein